MYELLKTLENDYKYPIIELQHAYRIAGVVDVFKRKQKIYVKPENSYHIIKDHKEKLFFVVDKIKQHGVQDHFTTKNKHGISYQEFKHVMRREKEKSDTVRNEDYIWNLYIDKKSDQHLYFLFHNNTIKIGMALNVLNRIKQLKTALSGDYFCVVFDWKGFLERELHNSFSDLRLSGEWFKRTERIELFIKKYWTKDFGRVYKSK